MLLSAQATRYAHQLLDARAHARAVPPLSHADPQLSLSDGYDVAKSSLSIRTAQGEDLVGRKLGFAIPAIADKYGVKEPVWAPLYDTTVRYAEGNHGVQSLAGAVQPRIEPHIVFKLARTPAPQSGLAGIADCLEWMASGFEIMVCPYPDWSFDAVDAIAAFGLHGALIVGERQFLSEANRRNLAAVLADSSVSLSVSAPDYLALRAAGFGNDVMQSPVHALLHLHELLQRQPQFEPLTAGEIIASGGWTDAYPVASGQTWTSAFSGVEVPGLSISFV